MSRVSLTTDGSYSGSIPQTDTRGCYPSAFVLLHSTFEREKIQWLGQVDEFTYSHDRERWHVAGHVLGRIIKPEQQDIDEFVAPDARCSGEATCEPLPEDNPRLLKSILQHLAPASGPVPGWLARPKKRDLLVHIDPTKLNRHTAVFGQSGSGKSNALAVLVEQLHFGHSADIVILDPNGDFTRLTAALRTKDDVLAKLRTDKKEIVRLWSDYKSRIQPLHRGHRRAAHGVLERDTKAAHIRIHTASSLNDSLAPGVRPSDFSERELATLVGLHPVLNAGPYHGLLEACASAAESNPRFDYAKLVEWLAAVKGTGDIIRILDNHGMKQGRLWHPKSITDSIVAAAGCKKPWTIVYDLSGLDRRDQAIVSIAVCRAAWNAQKERKHNRSAKKKNARIRPTFLVVDEAQNVFPSGGESPYEELARDWGVRIAAEGRKYGLSLILCSQLPSKIHHNMLSEIGNLILMKMISQTDLDSIGEYLSYVKESLLNVSKGFERGEALLVGDIVKSPHVIEFMPRATQEIGDDFRLSPKQRML